MSAAAPCALDPGPRSVTPLLRCRTHEVAPTGDKGYVDAAYQQPPGKSQASPTPLLSISNCSALLVIGQLSVALGTPSPS